MDFGFFELVDFAGPIVVLALLLALLIVLWSLSLINLQVRLLQDRVDTLERESEELEQELETLMRRAPKHSHPPREPSPNDSLGDLLGARGDSAAPEEKKPDED